MNPIDLYGLGFSYAQCKTSALLIPLWNSPGKPAGYQIRPDEPRIDSKSKRKYLLRIGTRFRRSVLRPWRAWMLRVPARALRQMIEAATIPVLPEQHR